MQITYLTTTRSQIRCPQAIAAVAIQFNVIANTENIIKVWVSKI